MIRMMRCRCKIIQSKKIAVFLYSPLWSEGGWNFQFNGRKFFNRLSPKKKTVFKSQWFSRRWFGTDLIQKKRSENSSTCCPCGDLYFDWSISTKDANLKEEVPFMLNYFFYKKLNMVPNFFFHLRHTSGCIIKCLSHVFVTWKFSLGNNKKSFFSYLITEEAIITKGKHESADRWWWCAHYSHLHGHGPPEISCGIN